MKRESFNEIENIFRENIIYVQKALEFLEKIKNGFLYSTVIETSEAPHKDKAIDRNNEILKNLPNNFQASFEPITGRGASDDGRFSWKNTNVVLTSNTDSISLNQLNIPLEVGTTNADTTFFHIGQNHGVARWPYGHNKILVIYKPHYPLKKDNVESNIDLLDSIHKEVVFHGKKDSQEIDSLVKWLNESISKIEIPTSIYWHTSSQMDFMVHDIDSFFTTGYDDEKQICILISSGIIKPTRTENIIKCNTNIKVDLSLDNSLEKPFLVVHFYVNPI